MSYRDCILRVAQAAGRELSEKEIASIFERVHKAALDIKAGRTEARTGDMFDDVVRQAAQRAADELIHEAAVKQRQAQLQVAKLGARMGDAEAMRAAGIAPLEAVERTIRRSYDGQTNIESMEQRVAGHKAYFGRRLVETWTALGDDFLGFFQNKEKLHALVRELRGEDSGDALARKGAEAFRNTAEEARQVFNQAGGDVGKLDDWGMPQHHSQLRVAQAGRDAWVETVLPMLDRGRYADDIGRSWDDARLREFLGKAWDTIATNGHANSEPGQYAGAGKRANRHAESRQIHFKDADSVINYWQAFGERTAADILIGHVDTMARDIAFLEHFGPNPDITYRTMRDAALKAATVVDPVKTASLEGRAHKLDLLYDYAAGRTKPTANAAVSGTADAIAQLNVAGKLGGAMWASLFGDKVLMETVSHLNNLPLLQRWRTELATLNPTNSADRRLLQQQGLMLEGVRGGLNRFYEGLGQTGLTGKLANAVMRVSGMNAINEMRKGAFGASLFSAIGNEIAAGKSFKDLADSDIRTLKHYGITADDWAIWQKAKLQDLGHGNTTALTPDAIAGIEGIDAAAKRNAMVKLLGAVNTEADFAIVTPGWKERAQFYGDLQRGTVKGEIARSALQFKSFPWAQFQRMMDAVANKEGYVGKSAMTASLIICSTVAGAMIMQVRDMLSGKDPRDMTDWKFWPAAFLQGGALGIYGDFMYGASNTRYGSGPVEVLAGPTIGPLLEMGLVQPLQAVKKTMEGRETHLAAQTLQDVKGFIPGNNLWYTKAATDHLIMQQVMEQLSPGYLSSIRSQTQREYGQDWWWTPGQAAPDRAPDLKAAIGE
ncbi:MAG: hypothetical protein AMXMBFR76_25360 [Pseudomonadota bacterium]